jgi:putative aminopeptidase FrvX
MSPTLSEHPVMRLFTTLLDVPSPSGREDQLAQIIRDTLDEWGYTSSTDASGNVSVKLPGQQADAPLCCLAAHMDEIGLVVTGINADGSMNVARSGGLLPWKIGEGPVQILGDEESVLGVVSMGSGHASAAGDDKLTWEKVKIITGRSPEELIALGVRPGSAAVPIRQVRGPVLLGDDVDPLVGAWTFDDRMGVVALLRMLKRIKSDGLAPLRPMIVAFTVQEEVGGQGAKALAQRLRPETFIAIDGCPIPPGAPLELDGRPGIWSADRLAVYDQGLVRSLCQAAVKAGTQLQPVVYDSTASDAGMVFSVGGAQRVVCFGHVRENSHGYEVARLSVFENVVNTLIEFVTTWEG